MIRSRGNLHFSFQSFEISFNYFLVRTATYIQDLIAMKNAARSRIADGCYVNILFMVLTTLIPDTQGSELTQDGAYLISGMRKGVKTVKIQHVSVACTGHVGHV